MRTEETAERSIVIFSEPISLPGTTHREIDFIPNHQRWLIQSSLIHPGVELDFRELGMIYLADGTQRTGFVYLSDDTRNSYSVLFQLDENARRVKWRGVTTYDIFGDGSYPIRTPDPSLMVTGFGKPFYHGNFSLAVDLTAEDVALDINRYDTQDPNTPRLNVWFTKKIGTPQMAELADPRKLESDRVFELISLRYLSIPAIS